MARDLIILELKEILSQKSFYLDEHDINFADENTILEESLGLDSLDMYELAIEITNKYQIYIDDKDIKRFKYLTLGEIADCINDKLFP